ncbi:MAG: HD domain-containing protein [Phycisphaeraceae bacterium]
MMLSERFDEAMNLALQLHRQQLRKGKGVPYISHLLAVTAIVLEQGGDEDQAIAAMLHDAAEDQGGQPTLDAIRRQFGDRVADMIASLSDAMPMPGQDKAPWRRRKEAYLGHLHDALPEVLLISAADKIANARDILGDVRAQGPSALDRFKGGRDGTLWYYRQIVETLSVTGPVALAQELDRVVTQLMNLAAAAPAVPAG